MSTLQQIRDKVRTQTDLDDEDLPDEPLDSFIEEAFHRTYAAENRWPFLQHTWTLTLNPGASTVAVPTDYEIGFIERMVDTTDYAVLMEMPHWLAEDTYEDYGGGTPEVFSRWGSTIYLWPAPSHADTHTLRMRGYRRAKWTGTANAELDGDDRLHMAIMHYACALAYAQLEDPEAESQYMTRWSQLMNAYKRDVLRPQFSRPLVLNGGWPTRSKSYVWLDV